VDKIELEILGLSSSQSQSGSFALVLGEVGGKRRLPIIIGMFEAQAIAIEIEKIKPNRPMTHDLFKSMSDKFEVKVQETYISDLKEGVFYAQIRCSNGYDHHEVDARPSDAIAIGLRFGASLYTNEKILSEAGIILTSEEEEAELGISVSEQDKNKASSDRKKAADKEKQLSDLSTTELNKRLEKAIADEQYETAAKIRDELDRRTN